MNARAQLAILAGVIGAGMLFSRDAIGALMEDDDTDFTRWDSLIRLSARKYGVPWRWVKGVMMNESNLGNASSVRRGLASPTDADGSKSSDGKSWGLMQVTLTTAQEMRPGTTVKDLNTPQISIDLGTQYLSKMIAKFGQGDRASVVRAYNGGPGWARTATGQALTLTYWQRFERNLAKILERQPGNPNEV